MSAVLDRLLEKTRDLKARVFAVGDWDESKHPRVPAGSDKGGGRWVEAYHGTEVKVVKSIRQKGLLARFPMWDTVSKKDRHAVFVTRDLDMARSIADTGLTGRIPVIITLRIPKADWEKTFIKHGPSDSYFRFGKIPPEWIKSIEGRDGKKYAEEDFIIAYVVAALDDAGDVITYDPLDVMKAYADRAITHLGGGGSEILATADANGRVTPSTALVQPRSRVFRPSRSPTPILAFADAAGRVYAEWDEGKHGRGKTSDKSRGGSFAPKSGLETRALREQASDAIYAKLSSEQQDHLFNYSGAGPDLSGELRNGLELSPYSKKQLVVMDQVFDQYAVNIGPTTLYRIVDKADAGLLVPGYKFTDKAFVSTSASTQGLASVIAGSEESGSEYVRLHIEVPAGTRALPMSGKWNTYFRDQDEVLLRRGSNFEVVSRTLDLITLRLLSGVNKFSTYSIARPLYVSRHVENADEIIAWAKSVGFETTLPAEDMHVTVCYSKDLVDWLALDHWADTLEVPPEGVRTLAWDEGKHPRSPSGSDKGGQWIDVYHGTIARVAASIRKHGLLAKYPMPETNVKKVRNVVFVTTDFSMAEKTAIRSEGVPVIVTLRIPRKVWEKTFIRGVFGHYHFGDIPPSWISSITGLNGKQYSYSDNEFITAYIVVSLDDKADIVLHKFHSVAESHNDRTISVLGTRPAVVLRFESAPLAARHRYFLDHGASWDYDEYHPHITIKYQVPEGMDLSKIEPYTGRIVLGPEQFQELETGWAEDVKEHAEEDGVWRTIRGRKVFIREGEDLDTALNRSLGSSASSDVSIVKTNKSLRVKAPWGYAQLLKKGTWTLNEIKIEKEFRGQGRAWVLMRKAFGVVGPFKFSDVQTPDGRKLFAAVQKKGLIDRSGKVTFLSQCEYVEQVPSVIDYAQIEKDLDAMEAKFRDELRAVLVESRDALLAAVKRKGTLPRDFTLPYAKDVQDVIGMALRRAMDRGGADAGKEIGRAKTRQYAEWDGSKHPREPAGSDKGGEFATIIDSTADAVGLDLSDAISLYRAHGSDEDLEKIHQWSSFTPSLDDAKRYQDNPGFGGPYIREVRVNGAEVIRLPLSDSGTVHLRKFGSLLGWGGEDLDNKIDGWKMDSKGGKYPWENDQEAANRLTFYVKEQGGKFFRYTDDFPRDDTITIVPIVDMDVKPVKKAYTEKHDYASTPTFSPKAALRWLREKIFWVADVLTTGLEEDIRSAILNGLKTGKPNSEIITDIAQKYIPYLGDPAAVKGGELPTATRLETVVRTNLVEAYNQGRITTFVRPDMMPFLDGIQYSAILDSRTTPVCQFLHDKIFKPDEIQQTGLTPPNHFNCFLQSDTKVFTAKGWRCIKDIELGDLVLTKKGRFRPVTYLHHRQNPVSYKGEVIRLIFDRNNRSGQARVNPFGLSLTPDHPMLTKRGWVAAKDIHAGDQIVSLGRKCTHCGKVFPWIYVPSSGEGGHFCSKVCQVTAAWTDKEASRKRIAKTVSTRLANDNYKWTDGCREKQLAAWTPERRERQAELSSQQMIREFSDGTRDRNTAMKAAQDKHRELVISGQYVVSEEGTRRQAEGRINSEKWQRSVTELRRGDLNPMRIHPEIAKQNGDRLVARWRNNPKLHPNYGMINTSKPQKKLFGVAQQLFPRAKLNDPVKTKRSVRFVDVSLRKYKIALEYDSSYWHNSPRKDLRRTLELREVGWSVIRYRDRVPTVDELKSDIQRVLNNHSNDYVFTSIVVKDAIKYKLKKARLLYNMAVEEDESYIVYGFVSANCRSLVVPVPVGVISKPPDYKVDPKVYITSAEIEHARSLADAKFLEQVDEDVHDHVWDEDKHPRYPGGSDKGGEFAPTDLSAAAGAISKMDPDARDNTEIGDFPGHSAGYNLYEARKMLPKPSDKLKRVTDSNSFNLAQEYDYIANVDGKHFGIGKYEDPDEPDDESKFVFAFKRLDQPGFKMTETMTADPQELFAETRKHKYVAEEDGVWRTVRGRHVFIREGEDLDTALKRSLEKSGRGVDTFESFVTSHEKEVRRAASSRSAKEAIDLYQLGDASVNQVLRAKSRLDWVEEERKSVENMWSDRERERDPGFVKQRSKELVKAAGEHYDDRMRDFRAIDSSLVPLKNDMTVYRVVGKDFVVKKGMVFTERGFMSTSFDSSGAKSSPRGRGMGSTLIAIRVSRGTRMTIPGLVTGSMGEKEILLERGLKVKVIGTTSRVVRGRHIKIFNAEIL